MIESLLLGGGFAFAAAVQPGPLQAFLLARVTERGPASVLPAAFSPLLSDGPIAVLALLLLGSPLNGRIPGVVGGIARRAQQLRLIDHIEPTVNLPDAFEVSLIEPVGAAERESHTVK